MPSLLQKLIEFVSTDRTEHASGKGSRSQAGVNFMNANFWVWPLKILIIVYVTVKR